MPQSILPLFSNNIKEVSTHIGVKQDGDFVYWFQGSLPVFCHHKHDQTGFREFCCQLINLGNATAAEIGRALGVNHEKLSRWAREAREDSHSPLHNDTSNRVKKNPTS